jgi:hypothetical protein
MHLNDVGAAVGTTINNPVPVVAPGGGLISGYADKTVAITGTFGAGGNVAMEGSLDGANFFTLTDPQGNLLNIPAAGPFIKAITEAVIQIRPHVTGGDGTTSLTVTLFQRGTPED